MRFLLLTVQLIALSIIPPSLSAETVLPIRPLFLVPGIVGSTLEEDGKVIWGDISSLNKTRFVKLDLLPANGSPVPLKPGTSIERISMLFGLIEFDVYDHLLEFLEKELHYRQGKNLFVFAYDWRRTNFVNAKRLNDFINEHASTRDYDLIAHSMGGIITRIMLDDKGRHPNWPCVSHKPEHPELRGLKRNELDTLCNTLYGPADRVIWPTRMFNGPFSEASRLHTFVELAVPHQGSVSVIGSLFEGWGALSRVLTGGIDTIQSVLLSMPAPLELAPTYENCCARGVPGGRYNIKLTEPLKFSIWTNEILRFAETPCPYHCCDMRRKIAAAALVSRATIRDIMKAGIPNSVKAHYTIVGRGIKNTRETFYILDKGQSSEAKIAYRMTSDGDGTVHSVSAAPPESKGERNTIAAVHTKHSFIFNDVGVRQQLKWIILRPLTTKVEPVAGEELFLAGLPIASLGIDVNPRIALPSDQIHVELVISSKREQSFAPDKIADQVVKTVMSDASTGQFIREIELLLDASSSDTENGYLVFSGVLKAPECSSVYRLAILNASSPKVPIGETQLHVIEGECPE